MLVNLHELKKQFIEKTKGNNCEEYIAILDNLRTDYNFLYTALYSENISDMKPEKEKEMAYAKELLQKKKSAEMPITPQEIWSVKYNLLYYKKDTLEARKVTTEYVSLIEQRQGKESKEYCEALQMVCETYKWEDADVIPLLRELLRLQENIYGKDHASYKATQIFLTNALSSNHQMQEAILSQSSATNQDDAISLLMLSTQQAQYGQYREAIETYEKLLEYCIIHPEDRGAYLYTALFGPISTYATLRDIKGLLSFGTKWSNDNRLEPFWQKFIFSQVISFASLSGKDCDDSFRFIDNYLLSHPSAISSIDEQAEILEHKASIYVGMKQFAQAEEIICQILSYLRQEKADQRTIIKYEQYLEICLMLQERWEDALTQNKKVLSMMCQLPDYKNYMEFKALCCRATIYYNEQNEFDEVLRLCEEINNSDTIQYSQMSSTAFLNFNAFSMILEISKDAMEQPYYRALYMKGMKKEAEEMMKKDIVEKESLIKFSLSQMNSRNSQNNTIWTKKANDNLCNIAKLVDNDSTTIKVFDYMLLYKQSFLAAENLMRQQLLNSEDESIRTKFNELQNLRTAVLQQKTNGLPTKESEERILVLEKQLVEDAKIYGDFTKNLNLKWNNIRERLQHNDIAIEFLSYISFEDNEEHIAALLLRSDWDAPKLIHLFSTSQIPAQIYDNVAFSKLCWKPICQYLKGCDNIYFAPAGTLYNIGIESLPSPDGKGYMSDKYNLYRISSTRELVKHFDSAQTQKGKAVIYGGIDYQPEDNTSIITDTNTLAHEESSALRSLRGAMGNIDYLPGTKAEAENVAEIFDSWDNEIEPQLFIGSQGTEASFRSISGKDVKIAHISTHGFYNTQSSTQSSISNLLQQETEDEALTRSGLLFAGAEHILSNDKVIANSDNDGILTAQEISTLDLRTLDHTTLSACQTAQGDISGDGVFGLQRGFKKAGANSILMSLWKVDDEATCLLMTEFYKNWIGEHKTKHKALELAKKTVKSHKEKGWDNPKYWAAFILLDGLK